MDGWVISERDILISRDNVIWLFVFGVCENYPLLQHVRRASEHNQLLTRAARYGFGATHNRANYALSSSMYDDSVCTGV